MPRPTKRSAGIAEVIGESPSRVQGWSDAGYGPAGDQDAAEHFRQLAPLMGTGRDGDVAVLKMAADGWPCRRLRDVLRSLNEYDAEGPTFDDPDELVAAVMGDPTLPGWSLMLSDAPTEPPPEWSAAGMLDEPDLPELLTASAMLPIADAATGRSVEPDDLADLDRHGPWQRLGLSAAPPLFDFEIAGLSLATLRTAVEVVLRGRAWIETTPVTELAAGVAAADIFVEALAALYPVARAWGDEERWRMVGRMAPSATAILRVLAVAVDLLDGPGNGFPHTPEIDAFLDAIRKGRPKEPPAATS